MRARPLLLSALSAASLLTLALTVSVTPAMAQYPGSPPASRLVTVTFQSTDARQAIRELFKTTGLSYAISPTVQGAITAEIQNVPFETALQNILRQVDATYRVEGGVYQIVSLHETEGPIMEGKAGMLPLPPATDPPAIAVDGSFVFVVQHGVLTKVDKKTLKILGRVILGPGGRGGLPGGGLGGGGFGR